MRYLSKASFGTFAYALSVVMAGEAIAAFGLRRGVSRFIPIYEERGEDGKALGTLVFSIAAVLSLGLAVVLVVIGLRGLIAGGVAGETEAVTVLSIMIALVPVQALGTLLDGAFAVYSRPRAIVFRKFVYAPLTRLAVVGLLAAAGAGVVFLSAGYLVAGVVGIAIYASMLVGVLRERRLLEHIRARNIRFPIREVLSFTVPLLSNDVTNAVLLASGGVILGLLASVTEVADFRAVWPVAMTMSYVLTSFGLLFVPIASRMYAREDWPALNHLYWQTTAWSTVLAFPIFLTCVALAEPLTVLLFGERYESSAPVLAVLAVGEFVNASLGQNGVLLGVFNRVGYIVVTNLVGLAVNAALVLALIPSFGAVGAAVATAATMLALNAVRQAGVAHRTDVSAWDARYWRIYAVLGAATLAALAASLALSPPTGVEVAIVAIACLAVVATARSRLDLVQTFPELAGLPVVGRLAGRR